MPDTVPSFARRHDVPVRTSTTGMSNEGAQLLSLSPALEKSNVDGIDLPMKDAPASEAPTREPETSENSRTIEARDDGGDNKSRAQGRTHFWEKGKNQTTPQTSQKTQMKPVNQQVQPRTDQRQRQPTQTRDGQQQRQQPTPALDDEQQQPAEALGGQQQQPAQALDGQQQQQQQTKALDGQQKQPTQALDDQQDRQQQPTQALDDQQDRQQQPTQALDDQQDRQQQPTQALDVQQQQQQQQPDLGDGKLSILGGSMRGMVDLVNRLRASGIEDLGMPLPRIAVVGNQSAGKSSLIEAISGIKVPRYSGTCTRCPLEISLREAVGSDDANAWSCQISLRLRKTHNQQAHNNNPWVDAPTQQVHFLDIKDKTLVECALKRAQTAILNPSTPWTVYSDLTYSDPVHGPDELARLNGVVPPMVISTTQEQRSDDEGLEVKFSPNVVFMEITGPKLPNLAFIDLPGVIQTTENDAEHYLIELVHGLVKEHAKQPDCLILLAMTMKDDAVNQSAGRIARQLGEDRIIGALTKPDTVEPGDHNQWIQILRGRSHRLKHGYFVTKQPNQDALRNGGVDNVTARMQEEEFFRTNEPWCTELKDLQHKFGTIKLADYLAKELAALIKKRLPLIINKIERQTAEVEEQLERLPAPSSDNQVVIVDRLLTSFDRELSENLSGINGKNKFPSELKSLMDNLTRELANTRPQILFLPTLDDEAKNLERCRKPGTPQKTLTGPFQSNGAQGQQREVTPTPIRRNGGGPDTVQTPAKRALQETPESSQSNPPFKMRAIAVEHKYTLPRIRSIIESTSTTGLPNQVDPEAVNNVVRQTLKVWETYIRTFRQSLSYYVNETFYHCFRIHFSRYDRSPIYDKVAGILGEFIRNALSQFEASIERLWKLESMLVTTLNQQDFEALKHAHEYVLSDRRRRNLDEQRETLKAERERIRVQREQLEQPQTPPPSGKGRGGRGGGGGRGRPPSPVQDEVIYDQYMRELGVLAQVQAYHDIARKRFVDMIYMTVLGEFVETCKHGVLEELKTQLGMQKNDAEDTCKSLLVEDPQKEKLRKELIGKRDQLQRAQDELRVHLYGV